MSAAGAPGSAGGAAGPSTASGESDLGPEERSALFEHPATLLGEDQAGALLAALLSKGEPGVAGVRRLLQDTEA